MPFDFILESLAFEVDGNYPKYGMERIKESELKQELFILNEIDFKVGSSKFLTKQKRERPCS